MEQNKRQLRLSAAGASFLVGFTALVYLIYRTVETLHGQIDITAQLQTPIAAIVMVFSVISYLLIWRGHYTSGTILLFVLTIGTPFCAGVMVEGAGLSSSIYLALISAALIGWILPKRLARGSAITSAIAIVIIMAFEILNPGFRVSISVVSNYPTLIAIFLFATLFPLFSIQMWTSGRLRNRIIALMIGILLPLQIIFAYINIKSEQQVLETSLLDRAKAAAKTGAITIGASLEEAISSNQLTEAEVFDQNYVKYFEFNPAKYPDLEGNPRDYDKYHTAYDSFTDEHWQKLLDAYLEDKDFIAATASDINGYLPTHNTVFSSGDGNPATDRTKRIYADAISKAAVQNTEPFLQQIYVQSGTGKTIWDIASPIYVNGKHWGAFRVGVELVQNQTRALDAAIQASITSAILLFIVVIFAWALGNYITSPIEKLTKASQKAASGDLDTRIDIPGRDELTLLADAFNTMTTRLHELIDSLEERVATRTKDLATVAEVGTATATILETDRLLKEVVELTKERFHLYHSHIYLLDEEGENLVLTAGAGEAGRIMVSEKRSISLDREQSLVARAARERKGVIVNDVTEAPDFLPNPLLPNTRSELAVPMIAGGNLIGVFDVQSDQVGRFTEADIDIQTTLAAQIAISIQNVHSFEESKAQADLETLANAIGQKIQRATTVEDTLQVAIREIGLALSASRVTGHITTKHSDGNKS
jgi:putative methionine-R-sulfoxide reductase with GAF domain